MSLSQTLLPVENILIDLDVTSKKRLFEEVAEIFASHGAVDEGKVFQSLLSREKLGSTGLGCGAAIPHGRVSGLSEAKASFIRLKHSIAFEAHGEQLVDLVFAVLVPEQGNTEHLKILSHLAQKFSKEEVRNRLRVMQSPQEIADLLLED
ncbi:MAG: PTS sugar transporter subunit IIA [Neisseriaceae bacterium]